MSAAKVLASYTQVSQSGKGLGYMRLTWPPHPTMHRVSLRPMFLHLIITGAET